MPAIIDIVQVQTRRDMNAFINLPYRLYRGQPSWRPPLRILQKDGFNPKKNPGLKDLDVVYWLAKSEGRPVGRIASFVNHAHLAVNKDNSAHFGFLDSDPAYPEALPLLLEKAEHWARAQGMSALGGPYNFSVNEECGMLIEGFETPQMMLMPHGEARYPAAVEVAGYTKAMDTYAYIGNTVDGYPRPAVVTSMQAFVEKSDRLTIRPMRQNAFEEEIALAMNIFNDAWSDNWNFVPFSDAQVQHMAKDMKTLIDPAGFWFGELDGEAVGFVLMLPNLNEATYDLDGRLFPFGWLKLLWRLKVSRVKSARIPLMGLRRSVHKKRTGTALMLSMFEVCYAAVRPRGVHDVELSWVLENNLETRRMVTLASAKHYKTYRLYTKTL